MIFTPPSRHQPRTENAVRSIDKIASRPGESGPEQDHYAVLARMVADVSQDHAQLRTFIYEYLRVKLRKELYPQFVDGAWSEIEEQMRGLEAAINRIETEFAQNAPPLQFNSQPALSHRSGEQSLRSPADPSRGSQNTTRFGETGIPALSLIYTRPYGTGSLPIASGANGRPANPYLGRHLRSSFWRNIQLIAAVAIGIAIYTASDAERVINRLGLRWPDTPAKVSVINEAKKEQNGSVGKNELVPKSSEAVRQRASDIPIPTEYGAYAVVNGQLAELEQLPIKVPDPRVALSASFSMPSRTHLPVGQVQFVLFRRDLATNAPDRIAVRVVARVMRALTFGSVGNARITDIEQSWIIRNNSYQMRVGPFADNPEMIVVRLDPADFTFPAGRYALVLKGVGYDFTVDGPLTDVTHCLERTDALEAPIYSECRKL
jgi:hypothetical protein